MLHDDKGHTLFLEVKKGSDRVRSAQLRAWAGIKAILGADVGVVYLRREAQIYTPKTYELDLQKRCGRVLG